MKRSLTKRELDEMKKNSSKDGHTELKKTIQQQIENANLIQDK